MENHNVNAERLADRDKSSAPSGQADENKSWSGRILVSTGIAGAALIALCCASPFLVAGLLTAVGLGFILEDSILIGLLILFAAVAVIGYYFVQRAKHA